MNTYTTTAPTPHLGDDELLRLIDDDGDAGWRAERDRHIATCAQCARELELLGGDAATVSDWLDRAAFEDELLPLQPPQSLPQPLQAAQSQPLQLLQAAPSSQSARSAQSSQSAQSPRSSQSSPRQPLRHAWVATPWLRAAAILLMLAAPVAALPGLRAWIADAVTRGGGAEVRTMAAPEAVGDAATGDAAIVRFVPRAGAFAVTIDAGQADGVLRVRHGTGDEAVLETLAAAGATPVEPVVSAGSLQLRNTAAAAASYSLQLPPSVTRVTVTIAGVPVATLGATALRTGAEVPLQLP